MHLSAPMSIYHMYIIHKRKKHACLVLCADFSPAQPLTQARLTTYARFVAPSTTTFPRPLLEVIRVPRYAFLKFYDMGNREARIMCSSASLEVWRHDHQPDGRRRVPVVVMCRASQTVSHIRCPRVSNPPWYPCASPRRPAWRFWGGRCDAIRSAGCVRAWLL